MKTEMILVDDCAIEAVVGYRTWSVSALDGVVCLSGLTYRKQEWTPGVMERRCLCARNAVKHTCGIYAYNDPRRPLRRSTGCITGEVHLWGEVVVHERGYRAQYAKPSAFYLPTKPTSTLAGLPAYRLLTELAAYQWGVPVIYLSSR